MADRDDAHEKPGEGANPQPDELELLFGESDEADRLGKAHLTENQSLNAVEINTDFGNVHVGTDERQPEDELETGAIEDGVVLDELENVDRSGAAPDAAAGIDAANAGAGFEDGFTGRAAREDAGGEIDRAPIERTQAEFPRGSAGLQTEPPAGLDRGVDEDLTVRRENPPAESEPEIQSGSAPPAPEAAIRASSDEEPPVQPDTDAAGNDDANAVPANTAIGQVSDIDDAADTVSENAGAGDGVGITVRASDFDLGDSVRYSLLQDADGLFRIDPRSGEVQVADPSLLDFETAGEHEITVRAVSSDGSTSAKTFTIAVTDEGGEAAIGAITDADSAANAVSESLANGSAVGITALATDADASDSVTYSLTDDAGGRFAIDSATGVVTIADTSLLDFESLTSHDITVKATSSDGSTSTETLTINLTDDTSEAAVGAISDANSAANSVSESLANGSAVGITALATDADASDSVTYSLTDDAGGRFAIDSATGVVTIADTSLLDFESLTAHDITVRATSSDGSTSTETLTINLTDDTSEAAVGAISDANSAANSVSESLANGSAVGITALATDVDASDSVTYSLTDDAGGRFAIDSATGVVTIADTSQLDFENLTSHDITVRATSSDGSTSTETLTINLTDDTSEAAVGALSDANSAANSVSESLANGSAVGITALATDADASDSVTYSLTDDAGGRFAIDSATGVVTIADTSLLDFESLTAHDITVKATSSDGSTSTETLTINLTDDTSEAAVGAISDANSAANSVSESLANGSAVGITALATDADASDSVTYSLTDDAGGRFAIDSATGVVTIADTSLLDFESLTSHDITVKATSSDGSTSTETLTINLTDDTSEAAVGAISDANSAANSVSESLANGSAVGITALATDADASDSVTYSLTDDAGGRFAIDSATGVVTIADTSLLDFESLTAHDITVKATSSDGSTSTETLTINLTDDTSEASVGAISDANSAANSVSESLANGSAVGITALATDADASDSVTYSLTDDAGGRFAIDSTTGVVTIADTSLLDFESLTSHDITVKATSSDGSTSTETLTINLTDDTSEAAVGAISDANSAANSVSESLANGSAVGITALATDADASDSVTYSLTDDAGGRFAIDSATGVVTIADTSLLDFESLTSHDITVKATSSDGSTSTETLTINLTDDTSEAAVGAISDANSAANSVSESLANGSAVGITALANDADASDSVTYSLTDDAGGRFAIDSTTGVVTIADTSLLDFESLTAHDITVKATSSDGSTSTETLTINLTDDTSEAAVGAISDANSAANSVSESLANGSAVGITALATDADASDSVTYSLTDDAGGRFAIDSATGVVTIADTSLLDFESLTSHDITVKATSSDGSTSTETLTINLTDDTSEAAVGAISDANSAANSVSESLANGSAVGITALATDADTSDSVTYSLTDDAGGRFAIDSATGVVTIADTSLLDFESLTSHDITVKATSSDGSTSTETLTINLTDDTSEAAVGAISDANSAANSVSESLANGSAVGITALATDADASDSVTYSLTDDAGGRFAIDSATGVVTIADTSLLDFESLTAHDITVRATSSDGSTSTETLTINLTDDTSEAAVGAISDANSAANSVSENLANGSAVGITALATDADASDSVTYSLTDDAGGRFAIDSATGVVTIADTSLLDFENLAAHDITVKATSSDGSTSTEALTINLTDDTSEAAVGAISDANSAANSVSESLANGSAVGITALATDADASDSVTYSLTDDAGGRFAIDSATGVVTIADTSLLDFETATSHDITVKATSSDGSTSTETLTIDLTDDTSEDSVGAISDANSAENSISESLANGSAVGITALATDADASDSVTYSLTDDASGRFAIDSATGVVTIADSSQLDFESLTSHDITVKATSSDGSTSTETLTINLTDDTSEASVGAISDANSAANSVSESLANGSAVGITALATDADASDSVTYSLTDDAGGRFAIDSATGVVTIADTSLLDFESLTSHDITVKATSSDGSTSTETLTINLTDDTSEAAVGAISDANSAANSVSESLANGSAVGITALATDADTSDSVTYSLTDDAGGRFIIDSATGVVTIADTSQLDFESLTSHDITVRATSSDGSTSTETLTINLTDDTSEASVGAISDVNSAANSVSESLANGSAVGITALATDADASDSVTYSLTDDAGGRFAIDSATGVVTIADTSLLDFESLTAHDITVRATSSDGSTSNETLTINLTDDTSEASVGAISDANSAANSVSESLANGSAVGITALATDADASDSVTYSLTDDAGGRFAIDSVTGVVTIADTSLLDFESLTSHDITVKATSSDGSTSTETLTINLTDDTSEAAVGAISDANSAANSVSESLANGSAVGITALATDADASDSVTYSLTDDAGGRFAIDSATGVVTIADTSLLDFESLTSHDITVKATSSDGSTSTETLTINLTDDTSEAAVGAISDANSAANSVSESLANGSAVGITALATDADASDSVTYSLTDDAGGRFAIDSATGVVTIADTSLLDFESLTSHDITVKATSSDGSTSTETLTINLTDDTSEAAVGAISDANSAANSVSESLANGSAVGITALATDADASDSVTYSLTDDAGGRFAIDSATGVVTIADTSLLDFESLTSHDITVKATSSDGSTSTETLTINLTDDTSEAAVGAISDANSAANSVSESLANGSAVGITALATDADASDSVTYSLTDDAGGRFAIDSATGVVTIADTSLLDFESLTSHDITVKATSSDGSTSTETLTINLTDDTSEAAVGAISDANSAANSVSESLANGSAVGITALATDADASDSVTYSLTDSAGGRFAIDSATGVVTIADTSQLDFESLTSHDITVKATSSDGSTSTETLTINLTDDTSEAAVGAISDANSAANSVSESLANGSAVGITALATDADASDSVTYSLTDDAGGRFAIDSATGVVTIADTSLLDFESLTSHDISVRATSSDGSTSTETLTINLTDDTSEAAVGAISDVNTAANSIIESLSNGSAVGITASASDADGSDSVTYSLTDNAGGRFAIDSATGVVSVANSSLLDFETATSHDITVRATSSDGSTSTESFTVDLTDDGSESGVGAITDLNLAANSVSESASNGASAGVRAFATDADLLDTVSYSLSDDAGGRFTIDATTGAVTVADASLLDYESATSHDITIRATSSDGSTSTETVTVDLADDTSEAAVGAIVDANGAANTVSESASNGAAVGITAQASDADASDSVTYSLTDTAGGRFAIDSATGVVTVADASLLDYESATSHDITIRATSSDGSTSSETLTVNLSDDTSEAAVGAISDTNGAANSVSETALNGTAVGITALASDADGSDTVSYSLTDTAGGRFTIDSATGVVTVADASLLDYESATSHSITVRATSSDGSTSNETMTINLVDDTSEAAVGAISDSNGAADTVSESAANGASVGITAQASDADGSDSVTYSLADNAGGRFAIDASTGVVTVADTSLLDYETTASHQITVKATSSDGSTSTQNYTVSVADDADEADVGAVSDSNGAANSVSEDTSNGATVGITASASDADVADSVTYSLTDSAGGRFAIDANTGVVTVADATQLDYESAISHQITVKATSSDGSTSTSNFTVNLEDANDADVGAVTDANGSSNTISETASNGTAVGITASATDADSSDTVSYSLSDDAGGRFAIDASTGVVTVADNRLLDHDDSTSHSITVKATSSDGSTSTESFTVNLTADGQNIYGDNGDNSLYGGSGNDNIYSYNASGGSGSGRHWDDYLSGGDGNDRLYSGTGEDRHYGGSGNDSLYGGDDNDTLYGGDDDDRIYGGSHRDTLYGDMGNDSMFGGDGDDHMFGDARVYNQSYTAEELAADHDDTMDGGKGSDFMSGHLGNDSLIGGSGDDTIYGGEDDDTLDGGKGTDTLYGGSGNDYLDGGDKNDRLYGGSGNDHLVGGDNTDRLYGGSGHDTFSYVMGDDSDYVYGGNGGSWTDVVNLDSGVGTYGVDWTVSLSSGSITTSGDDYLQLSTDADGTISLSDGSTISFEGIERIEW